MGIKATEEHSDEVRRLEYIMIKGNCPYCISFQPNLSVSSITTHAGFLLEHVSFREFNHAPDGHHYLHEHVHTKLKCCTCTCAYDLDKVAHEICRLKNSW